MRPLFAIGTTVLVLLAAAPAALACFDNSDQVVRRLQKLDLNTDQLRAIFACQSEHRAFIAKSHHDGMGCLAHEKHDSVFEMQAIGVLNDNQFKSFTGRVRSADESLRFENYLLKTEIERLKAEIADFKKKGAELKVEKK
ncbi:MAG: hypothetical protein HY286_08020 [Planctomycetes bacterium]|nr:hypothetical protein [Planctomycetota bacterium]